MAKEMKILGFNFTKISGEKNPNFTGSLSMKQGINISLVEKHKLDLVKEECLKIGFNFSVDYSELGKIELSGILFLLLDPKSIKEALKSWEDKKLPEDIRLTVLNLVLQKASLRAFQIEEDLGLPLHMPLPRIQTEEKK